jgi:hypothetical protein
MRIKTFSALLLLAVFLLPGDFHVTAAAEAPAVLTIRPERLASRLQNLQAAVVRDPFNWPPEQIDSMQEARLKASAIDPFTELSLSGIMWDEKRPLAIINGRVVGPGDRINMVHVEQITKETVLLEHEGKNHLLEFQPFLLELHTD